MLLLCCSPQIVHVDVFKSVHHRWALSPSLVDCGPSNSLNFIRRTNTAVRLLRSCFSLAYNPPVLFYVVLASFKPVRESQEFTSANGIRFHRNKLLFYLLDMCLDTLPNPLTTCYTPVLYACFGSLRSSSSQLASTKALESSPIAVTLVELSDTWISVIFGNQGKHCSPSFDVIRRAPAVNRLVLRCFLLSCCLSSSHAQGRRCLRTVSKIKYVEVLITACFSFFLFLGVLSVSMQ